MIFTYTPAEVLQCWVDDPVYAATVSQLNEHLDIAVSADEADAVLCITAALAIARHRDLLVACRDEREWRHALSRVNAVADVCGRGTRARFTSTGRWSVLISFLDLDLEPAA